MAKEQKEQKPLKTIDFAEALTANQAVVDLMPNAEIDLEKRIAETEDIACFVATCTSSESPNDWEFLNFVAKTSKGIDLLAGHKFFQRGSGEKAETEETCKTGLFNYALGLRLRQSVSSQMKTAAEGPEKTINKALSGLQTVLDSLPEGPQREAMAALLKTFGK